MTANGSGEPTGGRPVRPVVPLRPLGATELLDGAVRVVGANARAIFTLAVPVAVVQVGLTAWQQVSFLDSNGSATFLFGTLAVPGLLGVVLAGLVAPIVGGAVRGRQLSAGAALRALGWRVLPLIGLALVVTIGQDVGLVLLVVGGVWLWGVWAVAAPALTIERAGLFGSLGRSFRLVSGDFWRVWGVRALAWLAAYIVRLVATLPFQALGAWLAGVDFSPGADSGHPAVYVAVLAVGSIIGAIVTLPFQSTVDTLLYLDLRMRREGMDLVMALPPPAAPAGAPAAQPGTGTGTATRPGTGTGTTAW